MATDIPLNPTLTFKHISVHMVHILARLAAKRLVQEQLRAEGVRLSLVKPREVNERATTYLHDHPEVWSLALQRAHQIGLMRQRASARRSASCAGKSWPDWRARRAVYG